MIPFSFCLNLPCGVRRQSLWLLWWSKRLSYPACWPFTNKVTCIVDNSWPLSQARFGANLNLIYLLYILFKLCCLFKFLYCYIHILCIINFICFDANGWWYDHPDLVSKLCVSLKNKDYIKQHTFKIVCFLVRDDFLFAATTPTHIWTDVWLALPVKFHSSAMPFLKSCMWQAANKHWKLLGR